jgi:DNA polymerase
MMSDDPVARSVKRHLDGLAAAGVTHLPRSAPLPPAAAPAGVSVGAGLFDAPADIPPAAAAARRHELAVLAEAVSTCPRCPELFATRTQTVFGTGPVDADLCFIGEAPGADEDRQGVPFVGASGQLLGKIIQAMGLTRDEVYICNTLKCRPPMNRQPAKDELANCRGYFDRQLELVRPKFICCLGATAATHVLGKKQPLGKMRGAFHDYKGTPVLVTFHPAALLRNPEWKKDVWEDMKTLLRRMGRPVPGNK